MKYLEKKFLTLLLLTFSFGVIQGQTFKSVLLDKKISETTLGEYIKEDVMGDQLILMIAYGCSHCREAAQKAIKLKRNNLIDDFIILGSEAEETDAKAGFLTTIGTNDYIKIVDYEWTTFPKKFIIPEPGFPNPPVIFYIHDNVIKLIMKDVPDAGEFKKMRGK